MPITRSRGLRRRPLWIISSYRNNRMDVFTIASDGNAETLAVFSFEEEAEAFLSLLEDDRKGDWQCRGTSSGELVSVLRGLWADVREVALDPLPVSYPGVSLPSVSLDRKRFEENLLGDSKS
jgi:hypothetical protein